MHVYGSANNRFVFFKVYNIIGLLNFQRWRITALLLNWLIIAANG